jgi:hypothetical protein
MGRRVQHQPLLPVHRRHLAELLAQLAPYAADPAHPLNTHAAHLLSTICWYWSADGYDPNAKRVVRDAFKTDWTRLRYTKEAHDQWQLNLALRKANRKHKEFAQIRHDHAVPRKKLLELMVRNPITVDRVEDVMSRLCVGVLVTKEQHEKTLLKSTMPPNWDEQDPYARYHYAKILLIP